MADRNDQTNEKAELKTANEGGIAASAK